MKKKINWQFHCINKSTRQYIYKAFIPGYYPIECLWLFNVHSRRFSVNSLVPDKKKFRFIFFSSNICIKIYCRTAENAYVWKVWRIFFLHTQDKKAISYIILDSFKWVVYNNNKKEENLHCRKKKHRKSLVNYHSPCIE